MMTIDEIDAVRDSMPAVEPDTTAKAQARARLYTEFRRSAEPTPVRTRRRGWRPGFVWPAAATAGVAASCLAVGLVVTHAGPDGTDTGRPGVVTSVEPGSRGSTARTMELAARAVEQRSFTEPGPHDWLYAKAVSEGEEEPYENWVRFDGEKSAFFMKGKLTTANVEYGAGENTPRQDYQFLADLPDDPDRARERIYEESERLEGSGWGDADARAFAYIMELFEDTTTMPPDAQATLYRALATIPGVRIESDVVDDAGRHGIGVTRGDGTDRTTLILGKDDYRYLGQRYVKEGDVISSSALVKLAVVDGPGDRS